VGYIWSTYVSSEVEGAFPSNAKDSSVSSFFAFIINPRIAPPAAPTHSPLLKPHPPPLFKIPHQNFLYSYTQMGFDDLSNTGLLLGLGLPLPSNPALLSHKPKKPVDLFSFPAPESEPSLTLGLSTPETYPVPAPETADLCRQPSPHSAISSFSGGRVKRERDVSGEDIEEEKACSRVSDEDEDGSIARKKLRLTKEQSALLEDSFKLHSTLNPVCTLLQLTTFFRFILFST